MFFSNEFNEKGKAECEKIGAYFTQMFSITPALVECNYIFDDYVIEITENGKPVNKFIISPGMNGNIDTIRVSGLSLNGYYNRFLNERKFLWLDVEDCERDGWGEYLEFSVKN